MGPEVMVSERDREGRPSVRFARDEGEGEGLDPQLAAGDPDPVAEESAKRPRGRGGRPPKAPGEKLTRTLGVRVTDAEMAQVADAAEALGATVRDLVRHVLFGDPLPRLEEPPWAREFRTSLLGVSDRLLELSRQGRVGPEQQQALAELHVSYEALADQLSRHYQVERRERRRQARGGMGSMVWRFKHGWRPDERGNWVKKATLPPRAKQ